MRKAVSKKQIRRRATIYGLGVTLIVISYVAAFGEIGATEAKVFDWVYSMPDGLRLFAIIATQLGNAWLVVGLVGLLFVIRKNPTLSLLVFRNGLLAFAIVEFMKFIVNRPRPMILLDQVTQRELVVFGNGFPSGHTAIATALSLTILPYLPKKLRWLAFVWIGLVAWSRMYLGVHAPLDVLGGFIIGALVVLLADALHWPKKASSKRS